MEISGVISVLAAGLILGLNNALVRPLPHMAPGFFTGMRLRMSATLPTVTQTFKPHYLFALTGVVTAVVIILNEVTRRAEIEYNRWRS